MKNFLTLGVALLISATPIVANQTYINESGKCTQDNVYISNIDKNTLFRVNFSKPGMLLQEKKENGNLFDFAKTDKVPEEKEIETDVEAEVPEIEEEEPEISPEIQEANRLYNEWTGPKLNRTIGTITGPSGKETYYNLPMGGVIKIMRSLGFSEAQYSYWVRDDGVKMFGPYIMVAADLNIRPKGTIVPTSLGVGMVCDTGTFAKTNNYQLDIAVAW